MAEDSGHFHDWGLSGSADRCDALDVIVLRLLAQKWHGRLEHPVGLGCTVTAAQLAELVLAGVLVEKDGIPVVRSHPTLAGGAFDPLRDRVNSLRGCRWYQLFWRRLVSTETLFNQVLDALVANELGALQRTGWRQRGVRWEDRCPEWARTSQLRTEAVLAGGVDPNPRESVLAALYRLGIGSDGARLSSWHESSPILTQPLLIGSQEDALLSIVTSAQYAFAGAQTDSGSSG
jgi:hypothetical protein